jgi:hypothetical protein
MQVAGVQTCSAVQALGRSLPKLSMRTDDGETRAEGASWDSDPLLLRSSAPRRCGRRGKATPPCAFDESNGPSIRIALANRSKCFGKQRDGSLVESLAWSVVVSGAPYHDSTTVVSPLLESFLAFCTGEKIVQDQKSPVLNALAPGLATRSRWKGDPDPAAVRSGSRSCMQRTCGHD